MASDTIGSPPQVELLEKNRPRQARAIKTYEAILAAAAELLVEVGVERISTNLIAERAGVTVPALYRYFPNKYAVLNTLGARLMDTQNEAFAQWHARYVHNQGLDHMLDHIYELLRTGYDLARERVGSVEIMHCMQSLAPLRAVRQESRWGIAELFGKIWCEIYGAEYSEDIRHKARMAVEVGNMTIQLALEETGGDPDALLREGAKTLRLYLSDAIFGVREDSRAG